MLLLVVIDPDLLGRHKNKFGSVVIKSTRLPSRIYKSTKMLSDLSVAI
jgi:hypothetical protein